MRPVAYVCLQDAAARARVIGVLERNNYAAIVQPTGFHLIRAMADVIEGRASRGPALIVVDAWAPGCAGKTIEAGLRDLGIRIPVLVVDGTDSTAPLVSIRATSPSRACPARGRGRTSGPGFAPYGASTS